MGLCDPVSQVGKQLKAPSSQISAKHRKTGQPRVLPSCWKRAPWLHSVLWVNQWASRIVVQGWDDVNNFPMQYRKIKTNAKAAVENSLAIPQKN